MGIALPHCQMDRLLKQCSQSCSSKCSPHVNVNVFDIGSMTPIYLDGYSEPVNDLTGRLGRVGGKGKGGSYARNNIIDPYGCRDSHSGFAPSCCITEDAFISDDTVALYMPCMICSVMPACVVDIPCGHINVCIGCYSDYSKNERCLRCRKSASARVDINPFLDPITGRPQQCNMCREADARVVILPCVHMCFCPRCLPQSVVGCPSCGDSVEQVCHAQWLPDSSRLGAVHSLPAVVAPTMLGDGSSGFREATEGINQEISRLEQQLSQLRTLSRRSAGAHSRRTPEVPPLPALPVRMNHLTKDDVSDRSLGSLQSNTSYDGRSSQCRWEEQAWGGTAQAATPSSDSAQSCEGEFRRALQKRCADAKSNKKATGSLKSHACDAHNQE